MSKPPKSVVVSPFDELVARVHVAAERHHIIALTSAVFGEGVSSTALGLALTLANTQSEPVLLVDANWLEPWLSTNTADGTQRGLAEVLRGEVRLVDAVRNTSKTLLSVLPAGFADLTEHRLDGLTAVIAEARKRFQYVIVDLPPILESVALVLAWTTVVDQLFVVVRSGATPTGLVRRALSALEPALVPALILNGARLEPTRRQAVPTASS